MNPPLNRRVHYRNTKLGFIVKILCRIIILFYFFTLASFSFAQDTSGEEKDWQVACMPQSFCELKQVIIHQDRVAASVSILNAGNHVWLQYLIPIGINIEHGIQLSVDAGTPINTTISNCTITGCAGYLDLTPELLAEMKKGFSLNITFLNPTVYEWFTIQFNLSGFASAFQILVNSPSSG